MARVKAAVITKKKHKKILKELKDFLEQNIIDSEQRSNEVMKSGNYAFAGRKRQKEQFQKNYGLLELMQVQE